MRKFLAILKMGIKDAIIYRNDLLLWSIGLMLGPLIYLIVWLAISVSGGTPPLSQTQFIQYYLLMMLVRTWANSWNSLRIASDIRTGEISPFLIRPIPYFSYRFGDSAGNRMIKAIFGLTSVLVLSLVFHAVMPQANSLQWLIFGISAFMSGVIMTVVDINIGLLAFWFDDVTSIDEFNDVLYMIFSGVIVPIIVFPDWIRQLLVYLPYKYMAAFPVQVLMGEIKGSDALLGLSIQAVWLVVFLVIYKVLWSKGQIKYQAYGA